MERYDALAVKARTCRVEAFFKMLIEEILEGVDLKEVGREAQGDLEVIRSFVDDCISEIEDSEKEDEEEEKGEDEESPATEIDKEVDR